MDVKKNVYMTIGENVREAKERFTSFLEENGYSAWHILDGWVRGEYDKINLSCNETLKIIWIHAHAGFNHSLGSPNVGEKMIIIKNSLNGNEFEPFDVYCYDVITKDWAIRPTSKMLTLKLIETKKVFFNKKTYEYQFFTPNNEGYSFWNFLKNKL